MAKILAQFGFLALVAMAAEPTGITRCQTGAADILGTRKAFAIQVCNLFGGKCYMNHPGTAAANCATEALEINPLECKLYPLFAFKDWGVRTAGDASEELSTVGDLGCSAKSSSGTYTWSESCVSVQCDLGAGTFAGPGMSQTGTSSTRTVGVKDTATQTFLANTVASLPAAAKQLKTVFLYRTGSYVATTKRSGSGSSNSVSYNIGDLPTSNGNNYGPVACPASNTLLSAATISAENLRMCGGTGKWVYYNAVNLLVDAGHYAKYSGNVGSTTDLNIGEANFLHGVSAYRSGTNMADARAVKLLSGATSSSTVLHTSATITPKADGAAKDQTAGTWRNYGVVFYCDDYARTDLTACKTENHKMFYVADPNPNAAYGTTAASIGGGVGAGGSTGTTSSTSGAFYALPGAALFATAIFAY